MATTQAPADLTTQADQPITTAAATTAPPPPPPPPARVTPRHTGLRPRAPPPPSSTSGIPSLLALTADKGRYTHTFDEQSSYVPSCHSLMRITDEMDQLMSTTRKFLENTPLWHPTISQFYMGFIFMIHTMRSQQANGLLPQPETEFLSWFEQNYGFNTIPVPGPIRPILEALAACPAPLPNYGNVSPTLPRTCTALATRFYCLSHGHAQLLPPLPVLMDQIILFCSTTAVPTIDYPWHANFFGTTYSGATVAHRVLATTPGISTNSTFVPLSVLTTFHANRSRLSGLLPPRYTNITDTTAIPWSEFLCFSQGNTITNAWFPQFLRTMSTYSLFFSGSCSLASIPLVAHSVPLNVYTWTRASNIGINPQTLNTAAAVAVTPRRVHSLECTGNCHDLESDDISNQYADVATLNTSYASLPAATQGTYPTANVIRFGPIWTTPATFGTPTLNLQPPLGALIASVYHSSTALKPQ